MILDIFSRYAVGWMLARVERAELSKRLINDTIDKQGVSRDQLTLHSDRGSPMIAQPVAHLLADLGVTKSHSRPHVSNDSPYSESQFRTFKYRPDFPDRFGSFEDARAHSGRFFTWYNDDHRSLGVNELLRDVARRRSWTSNATVLWGCCARQQLRVSWTSKCLPLRFLGRRARHYVARPQEPLL